MHTKTENTRPLSWTARLGRWWLRRSDPDLALLIESEEGLTKYKMAQRINTLKANCEKWRQRAFSAERALRGCVALTKQSAAQHDQAHGTDTSWMLS